MTTFNIIMKILTDSNRPLNLNEIYNISQEKRIWTTVSKTPTNR